MTPASSLLVNRTNGEQVVRRPRRWDTIGALLQRVYAVTRALPPPIDRLLQPIDQLPDTPGGGVSDRR